MSPRLTFIDQPQITRDMRDEAVSPLEQSLIEPPQSMPVIIQKSSDEDKALIDRL